VLKFRWPEEEEKIEEKEEVVIDKEIIVLK
jgi:hypothetical protein